MHTKAEFTDYKYFLWKDIIVSLRKYLDYTDSMSVQYV